MFRFCFTLILHSDETEYIREEAAKNKGATILVCRRTVFFVCVGFGVFIAAPAKLDRIECYSEVPDIVDRHIYILDRTSSASSLARY